MRPFYVTTPIYYVNDRPHLGTAYTTIAADVLARYARVRGRPTRFLTGLDEHGLKLERRAREEGMSPKDYVDRMVPPYRAAWELLGCAYDDFIRTTEPRHEQLVAEMWRRAERAGDIYLGDYEDWYCVGCEQFYTEKELLPGNVCPTHQKPVERLKEQSYFFRLSRYGEKLLAFYEATPEFVRPEGRFNEVKSFVKEGLRDLSVSRTSFRWGIPVPGAPEHVIYVWFDALTNYISALGGPAAPGAAPLYDQFWPPNAQAVHLVGKDILRFHAVYWPAFLMSAGVATPTQVWAHGWLTVNGQKMSKSSGHFMPAEPIAEGIGADVLRYYLMRDVAFGQDGDFNHQNLLARYHGDLGNGLGNLLNRMVASIVPKAFDGIVPHIHIDALEPIDRELIELAARAASSAAAHMDAIAPNRALEAMWELVAGANKYVDQTAPWALMKDEAQRKRLKQVVYTVLEAVRWMGVMLWPFMPEKCDALRLQLGLPRLMPVVGLDLWPSAWGGLEGGTRTQPGAPLFPRLDEAQQAALLERWGVGAAAATAEPAKKAAPNPGTVTGPATGPATATATATATGTATGPAPATAPTTGPAPATATAPATAPVITFDELTKIDLRLALIQSAERVPKSDKLLRLVVDAGDGAPRQILAGIGKHYEPEALVGKRVAIVANLAPRKMMGLESNGMVLAASDDSGLSVLLVDKDVAPGSKVK